MFISIREKNGFCKFKKLILKHSLSCERSLGVVLSTINITNPHQKKTLMFYCFGPNVRYQIVFNPPASKARREVAKNTSLYMVSKNLSPIYQAAHFTYFNKLVILGNIYARTYVSIFIILPARGRWGQVGRPKQSII